MTSLADLIETYNTLIVKDHHKDRDCHFYITKTYSYGHFVGWNVVHKGYCNSIEGNYGFDSEGEAENFLKETLSKWIDEELQSIKEYKAELETVVLLKEDMSLDS